MTKKEVANILVFINSIYPNFEITQEKIDTWTFLLENQDFEKVMENAGKYAMSNKFPPVIADLIEIKRESKTNDFLEKMKGWERDAVGSKP